MRAVIINTCQIIICLFAVSNGQIPTMSVIGGYVNKSGTAYIPCSIGTTLTGSVAIARNGALAFDCPVPNVCVNQGLSTDYNATQDVSSGTTTLIIQNADKNRDGVNWTCSYSGGNASVPVTPTVVSPATSKKIIEDRDKITLELICTYPTNSLSFIVYLGNVIYSEATPIRTVTQACTPNYEASVNYTLTFPKKHSKAYKGHFVVSINNGFYDEILVGITPYNFPVDCALESFLGLALGVGLGNDIICIICLILIVKLVEIDADKPIKGASKLILGLGFGIICVACIVCIVILVMIGEPCALKFAIGLGLGLGIPFAGCIIVIVILVKKGVKKASAPENGNAKSGSKSDVSRKDVEIQLEEKGVKSNEERPLVNHNRIGNKDDSEAEQVLSKPFDPKERRPLPPLNKEVKDKPTHYSQQIPSGKNDVKDKNSRGLSANFDDTQGLASEITRPSKLPPIEFQVQSTVQEEDTSEEPKNTKKNKRKKEKTDEEKHADKTAK